ncbi:MAG TPA: FAD:protein FMN transferase [Actinocrinis sp.]|nr:FAD:protein FMN transferase [Actinocrinis sp.]
MNAWPSAAACPPPAGVGRAQFPALGGTAVVLSADPDLIAAALGPVRIEVAAVDAACSRFRPDSDLSRVNAMAGTPVAVGALFAEALETALRAAELTGGDVDPTIGAGLVAAGYDRDFELLRARGVTLTVSGPVPAPGWRAIEWDRERAVVRIPAGSRLDFGATAKALAADRAARRAREAAGCGVLVSLSGDIAVAGPAPAGGWRVRVTDDHRSPVDAPGQTVTMVEGGLATSSTTVRRWTAAEDRETVADLGAGVGTAGPGQTAEAAEVGVPGVLHHILQPRTGRPAESCWRTVSVAASSCVDANIAATAAIVRGQAARRWLADAGLPARLVRHDGQVVTVARWPDPGSEETS